MAEQEDLAAAEEYMTQVNAARRTIQPRKAEDIAGVVAEYSTMSPDLAAAMAVSTLPSDYADMGSIVRRDLIQQPSIGRFLRENIPFVGPAAANVMGDVGASAAFVTRQVTAGMYDLWDASMPQALRTGTNAFQQYQRTGSIDMPKAWRQSYGTLASQQAVQVGLGEMSPMDVVKGKGTGTGIMVGRPENVEEMPGYGTEFSQRLLEGDTPEEAKSYTDKWADDKFGYDVVNGAWQQAEATRINVTVDGVDYDYGVSLGRVVMTPAYMAQILTPESIAARLITGTIDTASQVWMDPTDVVADSLTKGWARARKLQPDEISSVDELLQGAGGQRISSPFGEDPGPSVQGFEFRAGSETEAGTSGFSDQLLEATTAARDNGDEFVHVYKAEDTVPITPKERVHPDLENYQRLYSEAEYNKRIQVESLSEQSPEFADAIDEGIDVWDARIYLAEDEAALLADSLIDEQVALDELVAAADELPRADAVPIATLPIEDVEEMLAKQYLFLDGRGALDEAWKAVDEWNVTRVRGRWEARSPEEFLGSKDGKELVAYLADDATPTYKKVTRLRAAGVPMSTIDDWLGQIRRAEDAHFEALERAARLGDEFTGEIPPLPDKPKVAAENLEAWINGQKLTQRVTAPTSYRAANVVENSLTRLTGEARRPQPIRPFSSWGRRWAAHSTTSKIDPYDMDTTFETIVQFMRTIPGTTDNAIDNIVGEAMASRGSPQMAGTIRRALMEELEKAWKRKDIDDELILRTFERFFDEQDHQVFYNVDSLVNPIAEKDVMWRWQKTPGGVEFRVPANQASMAVELSVSNYHVPSIRQVRRATSPARKWRAKYLKRVQANPDAKLLMDDAEFQRYADIASSSWRTMQLLRPGWMMSVTPDEMARSVFDGHADLFANPMTAFNVFFRGVGDQMPSGKILDTMIELDGGMGAGAQKGMRAAERDMLTEQSTKPGGAWIPIRVVDERTGEITRVASEAYVREWIRHYNDPVSGLLYRLDGDLDAALEALTHPASPDRQIISDILNGNNKGAYPDPEIRLGKIDPETPEGQQAIKTLLELTEARRHLMTGGDWIRRDPMSRGLWLDSAGNRVDLYDGINERTGRPWTRDNMIAELEVKAAEQGTTPPRGYKRMRKADLQAALLETSDHTRGILDVPADRSYHIFKKGDPDLRNMLGSGKLSKERLHNLDARARALSEWGTSSGVAEGNRMFVVVDEAVDLADGIPVGSRVFKSASDASMRAKKGTSVVLVDMTALGDEAQIRLMEASLEGRLLDDIEYSPQTMRRFSSDEIGNATEEIADRSEQILIGPEMDSKELDGIAQFVREGAFADGYSPVPYIKGQARSVAERSTTSTRFIDGAFTIFGQKVSDKMARTPFMRIKVWEGFGDAYLHASPTIRKQIRVAAEEAGFTFDEFEAVVSRQMRIAGYKELPLPAKVQLTMEEIEQAAFARAIQRTRDLFFDLSKRSNFWDATKLIFPFGDAWWEVLSRWTKLFNPVKADEFGRPFKNLSRLESASVGAQRSGYYDTDEQGNRVYTWFPTTVMNQMLLEAFGEDSPGMDMVFGTSIDQALFINPADPRSLMGPGGSIQMQTAAALFRPLYEDKAVSDIIDWAVYGSWNPTEATSKDVVNSILPSYLRRFWDLLQVGEHDERYASRQIDIMNGMVASDPQYENFLTDPKVEQKLLDDARKFTIQMSLVEAVASIFGKVPRSSIEVYTYDTEGSESMRKLSAISADYAWLMNDAGMSQDEAVATVHQWYGIDPLAISPKSYMVVSRPLTKTGYDFMIQHSDEAQLLPLTIAAFMPPTSGDEFYQREYQRQISDEERQKLTMQQSVNLTSYRQGSERMQVVKDERDLKLAQAAAIYGKDSDVYREYRNGPVNEWYNRARMNIEAAYFYEQGAGGPAGLMARPGIEQYKNEMVKIGTVGTAEHEAATKIDPQLTLALERVTDAWVANEEMSITLGKNPSWWYESTASTDPEAAMMRSTFQERLHRIVATLDEDTKRKMSWYVDTVMTPLLTGFDRDDPLVIDVAPLPLPGG